MKTKRFLSILLSLVLVLGMLPGMSLTASAEGNTTTITSPATTGTMTITLTIAEATHSVTITAGENMTTTGNASQTGLSGAMTDVVYTADDGYYFPTDYSVAEVNGITVTRDSFTQITVSGNPTADAEITLPAPTAKTDQTAPTGLSATKASSSTTTDGKISGVTAAMEYQIDGATTWTAVGENQTEITGLTTGTYKVRYAGTADKNASPATSVEVGVKVTQTITASDVTATYGDTDKFVSASVTDPAEGKGEISYAVKSGSENYIDVNASTGALTIKAVPPTDGKAYVNVIAAETNECQQATKEVTVTISKADCAPATVTANDRIYDGTEKPLVAVTGEATGGEMQYALGDANEATQPYTTSIPAKTEVGTYYVWYKVVGDENHIDTEPQLLTVKIYPLFAKYSLTLDGDIGVNFYLNLTEEQAAHASVTFKWMKNNTEKTETVNVSKTYKGYMVTCRVSASEIREDITAHLVIDDGQGKTLEETTIYSVAQYAYVILNDPEFANSYSSNPERLTQLQSLARAMLAYGDNAKVYFDTNAPAVEPAPTANIPEQYADYTKNLPDGVSFEGATLSLRSKTTLSLYFTTAGGTGDVQLTMDNKTENVDYEVLHSGNEYVIRIRNIPAAELADNFTVKVNGTGSVTYSPLTYCYKAQTSENSKLANTVKALYNYWDAAYKYFIG